MFSQHRLNSQNIRNGLLIGNGITSVYISIMTVTVFQQPHNNLWSNIYVRNVSPVLKVVGTTFSVTVHTKKVFYAFTVSLYTLAASTIVKLNIEQSWHSSIE